MINLDIKVGSIYAVHGGIYIGEMLVVVAITKNDIQLLSIPNMVNRNIPHDIFISGRNNDIIRYVEQCPDDIAQVCIKQHESNENANY